MWDYVQTKHLLKEILKLTIPSPATYYTLRGTGQGMHVGVQEQTSQHVENPIILEV